jgi:hypothetical protein
VISKRTPVQDAGGITYRTYRAAEADNQAVGRLAMARPAWVAMDRLGPATGVGPMTVLHAGPPLRPGEPVPVPLANSIALAAMYEGWAASLDDARRLVQAGAITLKPAQDHGVVVPLAGIASPSMAVHVIADLASGGRPAYAVVNEGLAPALRLGTGDTAVVQKLHWLNGELAAWLGEAVAQSPVELLPVIDAALRSGDDCHSKTVAGTNLILRRLRHSREGGPERVSRFLEEAGGFALNLWMGAVATAMRSAQGVPGSSLLTAAGGNGVAFGVQVSGIPGRWFCQPASPPATPGELPVAALPAIGDSAVLDCFGLGGMALDCAPDVAAALDGCLPDDAARRGGATMAIDHPALAGTKRRVGLLARRVAAAGPPLIVLGVLDASGQLGRISGGVYSPPAALFANACQALGDEALELA